MIGTAEQPGFSSLRERARTFRVAAWLGWQLTANWTDPLVFIIFAVLRPIASALILLVMYQVIAGGQKGEFFNYLYISNAFFTLVIGGMAEMPFVILDDREYYRMLKYIYTAPIHPLAYLMGRSAARVAIALVTAVILLAMGMLFMGLQLDLATVQWGWFAVYFVLGIVILMSLGLILAGVALVIARHAEFIGDVTAGAMLLFSGAYFPLDVLPGPLQAISLWNPITYWLEGLRRALSGGIMKTVIPGQEAAGPVALSPSLAVYDNWQLLGLLAIAAAITAAVGWFFFHWIEHQAKERGMIDRVTGY